LNQIAIGLDDDANFVFFFRKIKDQEIGKHINLSEFQSCKLINVSRTIDSKEQSSKVVDKVELVFITGAKNSSNAAFEFYNSEDSAQLNGELQFAEKWQIIINEQLKNKKKHNS